VPRSCATESEAPEPSIPTPIISTPHFTGRALTSPAEPSLHRLSPRPSAAQSLVRSGT
jgi:hypothetical protein